VSIFALDDGKIDFVNGSNDKKKKGKKDLLLM